LRSIDAFEVEQVKKNKTAWPPNQKFNEALDKVMTEFFPVKYAIRGGKAFISDTTTSTHLAK
jgi:methyl coenzyme M reductase subunit D